jgi:hypothetical protein
MSEPDWTREPAPWEDKLPPVPVRKATVDDAGCWVNGARGIYAGVAMVDIATGCGYQITPDDAPVLAWARTGRVASDEPGERLDWPEFWTEIQDEVTDWLTDNVAPDGYLFEWHDGDLMMWSGAASCEASGDRCQNLDHDHQLLSQYVTDSSV